MSQDNPIGERTLFRFDRDAFNTIAGAKFAVGVVVAIGLTTFTGLDLLIVLVSALLAWLTDMPGTLRHRVTGMAAFGAFGVGMIVLGATVIGDPLWFALAMFGVALVLTLPLAISGRGYQVGWATILFFFSIAPMTTTMATTELAIDHLIGVGIVMALTLLWPRGVGPFGRADAPDATEPDGIDDQVFVVVYALTVAVVMAFAIYVGASLLAVGSVWVANGAFFILGPSTRQSRVHGVERFLAVIAGGALGLLLVGLIDSTMVLTALWAGFGFIALASLNAGYFVMVWAYTSGMTMTWAVQGLRVGSLNLTERIIGEALAFMAAIAAVSFLQWWSDHREVATTVSATLASD